MEKLKNETKHYTPIPDGNSFMDDKGNDRMQEQIELNYKRIKFEVKEIIKNEMEQIKNDPDLGHLIKNKTDEQYEEE